MRGSGVAHAGDCAKCKERGGPGPVYAVADVESHVVPANVPDSDCAAVAALPLEDLAAEEGWGSICSTEE